MQPSSLTLSALALRHFLGAPTSFQLKILAALLDAVMDVTGVRRRGQVGEKWQELSDDEENLAGVSVPALIMVLASACGDGSAAGDRAIIIQSIAERTIGKVFSLFLEPSGAEDLRRPVLLLYQARRLVDEAARQIRSLDATSIAAAVAVCLAADARLFPTPDTPSAAEDRGRGDGEGGGGVNPRKRVDSPGAPGPDSPAKRAVWPAQGSVKPTGLPGHRLFQKATTKFTFKDLQASSHKFTLAPGSPGICLSYHNSLQCDRGAACHFTHEVPAGLLAGAQAVAALLLAEKK